MTVNQHYVWCMDNNCYKMWMQLLMYPNLNYSLAKPSLKLGHEWLIKSHIRQWMGLLFHIPISDKLWECPPWHFHEGLKQLTWLSHVCIQSPLPVTRDVKPFTFLINYFGVASGNLGWQSTYNDYRLKRSLNTIQYIGSLHSSLPSLQVPS